jgi:hypothetical protein
MLSRYYPKWELCFSKTNASPIALALRWVWVLLVAYTPTALPRQEPQFEGGSRGY